ncbi:Small subunit (SSU) processome component [Naganishia friedmannii]|uniref:Small subunit (SSU) processome component n=1 Tax=Naganishia friedmannii TaxID=89922 RepID=A0ACC2VF61_9TREE|nr:Small subunit (SSU) processome component [Naganishia friedmannii]
MRQLKHHEKKLLKKVDFLDWKQDASLRETKVMRRYHIQDREDYHKYNKLCGQLRSLIHRLSLLPAEDPYRRRREGEMLDKLYDMGILDTGSKPSDVENKVTVSAFARRRLAVVMTRLKMAETVSDAVRTIEQGHVRVGPTPVTDPALLVTRNMEDFVTWVDGSTRKRTIMRYNDELDDFDLL